jgi:mitochondrial fission protein ELM1
VVLLVGGETAHHFFNPSQAVEILHQAERATHALGGHLTVVTSPRTSDAAIEAMRSSARQAVFHLWKPHETRNPYLGYLAWADVLIVTGESESMLAEAAAAARPLYIVPLPCKPLSRKLTFTRWMTSIAAGRGPVTSIARALLNSGWVTPYRDLEKMHALMYQARLARPFENGLNLQPPATGNTLEAVSERLHQLLDPDGSRS